MWRHGSKADGGFDAVIGNPPWDLLQMQEVEWFCRTKTRIAGASPGS